MRFRMSLINRQRYMPYCIKFSLFNIYIYFTKAENMTRCQYQQMVITKASIQQLKNT